RADFQQTDDERQVALQLLRDTFALSDAELQQLEANAAEEVDASTCLHGFVQTINETANFDDKVQLVESLWRVAYADGDLDKYEEHLIRRIADLIYLPHDAFIRAKLSAI
ncbi:MAG: TerB family tellurite resistance protein, partial [Halieaceae bacterium]|nr:TerB family tellurite resistance protein [Halieaceae bacterium]